MLELRNEIAGLLSAGVDYYEVADKVLDLLRGTPLGGLLNTLGHKWVAFNIPESHSMFDTASIKWTPPPGPSRVLLVSEKTEEES